MALPRTIDKIGNPIKNLYTKPRIITCSVYEKWKNQSLINLHRKSGNPDDVIKTLIPYKKEILFNRSPKIQLYHRKYIYYKTVSDTSNDIRLAKLDFSEKYLYDIKTNIPKSINNIDMISDVLCQWGFNDISTEVNKIICVKNPKHKITMKYHEKKIIDIKYINTELQIDIRDIFHLPNILQEVSNIVNSKDMLEQR